jgi:hypothetical protein
LPQEWVGLVEIARKTEAAFQNCVCVVHVVAEISVAFLLR